ASTLKMVLIKWIKPKKLASTLKMVLIKWIKPKKLASTLKMVLIKWIKPKKLALRSKMALIKRIMQNMRKQIFSECFPSTGYKHAGTPEFELYPSKDPHIPDLYSEISIPLNKIIFSTTFGNRECLQEKLKEIHFVSVLQ
ncbi:GyrI-like domain-containing protein, partial [Gracilibacillus dipsosauri]